MFGVLVVATPDGRIGFLRAFSGMLDGSWHRDGFVPPAFDVAARDAFWPAAEAALATLPPAERSERSRVLLRRLHDTYAIANARGEVRSLRELFAPGEPPGGAGDCAAPKLLAYAYRHQLRPLALAELWWGPPPRSGGRIAGRFYPACRGKCGPILGHALAGVPVDPPPVFASDPAAEARVIFEDAHLIALAKPAGLLSVPGRGHHMRDSALARLQQAHSDARVVHRLDLDTSGVLLAAKDLATYIALQRQFSERAIAKHYVALLDGDVRGDAGSVELALRVDLDDRPRQIVDPVHGKPALTSWRVLARGGGTTRVVLVPHTGRTHQLRVHAACGIGAPIVGDRLYGRGGRGGDRLHLHAERLAFVHPHTGERIELVCPTAW